MSEETTEFKIPKTLGQCADLLHKLRAQRYEYQHKVDAIKKYEAAVEEHVINELPKSNATGIAGKFARIVVKNKQVAQVSDWAALYAYIGKKKAFDLLQRRLSDPAVKERWDAKEKVPGVESIEIPKVSVTKI